MATYTTQQLQAASRGEFGGTPGYYVSGPKGDVFLSQPEYEAARQEAARPTQAQSIESAVQTAVAKQLSSDPAVKAQQIKIAEEQARTEALEIARAREGEIGADIRLGQELLGKEFEEGALGRIEAERGADIASVIEAKRASMAGLQAPEVQALRERQTEQIQRGTQTALREMRGIQGRMGIRGAAGAAQQRGIIQAGQKSLADVERDLLIRQIEERQQGVQAFEESVRAAEAEEEARRIFNLEQAAAEKFGRLSSGLGFAQLGVAERASERGVQAAAATPVPEAGGKF